MNSTNTELMARFALMGNTDDVIKWDKLEERIAQSPPAISTEMRCRLMLRIANGDKLTPTQWNQLVGATILKAPSDQRTLALAETDRAGLAEALQVIVDRKHAKLQQGIASAAHARVMVLPDLDGKGGRVIARNLQAALLYGLWIFIDPAQPSFGQSLCRCESSKCKRFYLLEQSGPGAPSRTACPDNPECRIVRNREKTLERMQILRGKRK